MSVSFQDLQEAIYLDDRDEFVIWQNSSQRNKRVKRGNLFASKGLTVTGKFIDAESGNDVGLKAATANANALLAIADAEGAQDTADGKNRIFYQETAPANPTGSYNLKENDIWFKINEGYKTHKWNGSSWQAYESDGDTVLSGLNVGKLTSGFISSKVIELSDSTAYLQSSKFIESWTSGRSFTAYVRPKVSPNHVDQCKVLQTDGTYRVYNAKRNNTNVEPPTGTFPAQNDDWLEIAVPTISVVIEQGQPAENIPDLGFRVIGQGQAEFHGVIARGAIVANKGFFGTTLNAVRLDDKGLTVGNNGYIKSRGIGYNGGSGVFTSTFGTSGGFFLGNTQAEGITPEVYQFFIGNPSGNNLRWNGTNLLINGSLGAFATGTSGTSGFGLTIASGFGIRYINNDSVLTITGGRENGVPSGAQIDLVGSGYLNGTGGRAGLLILQAGSGDGSAIVCNTNVGSDTSGKVGSTRLSIINTGLVSIVKSPTASNTIYTNGAGNLYVHSNLSAGMLPETQGMDGGIDGRVWASEEVVVYNNGADPAIRSAILKKTDGAGMLFLKNASDEVTVTLNGGIGEIQASSYKSTSSKRFKNKIKNLKNGLNLINSLRPVTFEWKNKNKLKDIGLIAEEVNEILPMVIAKNDKGEISGLDYGKLTPILIQAIKELYAEIHDLKSKIKL